MKVTKIKILLLTMLTILLWYGLFSVYAYIGTYWFPIAPYWVTQLPPNPPKPEIKHCEFDFKLTYSIDGVLKECSATIETKFDGFKVKSIGGSKERVWSENIKNKNSCELFYFRDEERNENKRTYSSICVENIGLYKVVLRLPKAEWLMGEPRHKTAPDMPHIQVYDTETRYYLTPTEGDMLLKEHNFKIVEWYCDEPLKNKFN